MGFGSQVGQPIDASHQARAPGDIAHIDHQLGTGRVVILSRGYGGSFRGACLVVSDGALLSAPVATTVTIGSVAYPMLQRAGYEKHAAGGLLAAGGLVFENLRVVCRNGTNLEARERMALASVPCCIPWPAR